MIICSCATLVSCDCCRRQAYQKMREDAKKHEIIIAGLNESYASPNRFGDLHWSPVHSRPTVVRLRNGCRSYTPPPDLTAELKQRQAMAAAMQASTPVDSARHILTMFPRVGPLRLALLGEYSVSVMYGSICRRRSNRSTIRRCTLAHTMRRSQSG